MAVPTYPWPALVAGMFDADSPWNETTATSVFQALVHLEEWLGMSYTAAQDHDHDGVNSKVAVMSDYALVFLSMWPDGTGVTVAGVHGDHHSVASIGHVKIPTGLTTLTMVARVRAGVDAANARAYFKVGAVESPSDDFLANGAWQITTGCTLDVSAQAGTTPTFDVLISTWSGGITVDVEWFIMYWS